MGVYSFLNVSATIVGPGGAFDLAYGAEAAEEGITITPVEDKNTMTIGADGSGMHSLIASDAATVTVRLLKTSPNNGRLMALYEAQSASSALWGKNVIAVIDSARQEITTCQACSFKKKPELTYAKDGGMIEWVFDCIKATSVLSTGN